MRRITPKGLLENLMAVQAVRPPPGQTAIKATGVQDVPAAGIKDDPVTERVASPDDAIVARMADYAVAYIQHEQRRQKLIADATELARNKLGLASDQRELDQQIKNLVTNNLG